MTDQLMDRCELLIRNRDAAKAAFSWEMGLTHLTCACIHTQRGKEIDTASLKAARDLLRSKTGAFSYFRGVGEDMHAAILDASGQPEVLLDRALEMYQLLKQDFYSSSYLPQAALTLAERADPMRFEEIAHRTRAIYERMRGEHPFLTSSEDSGLCALLALSDRSDDELIARMEQCYARLKERFFWANSVQSLSHVLALMPGNCDELCGRTEALAEQFKLHRRRWGSDYELPVLGLLAADPRDVKTLAETVLDCDDWLRKQPGFGFFSSVSEKQRLMFAGILVQENDAAVGAAVQSTVSSIIAGEIATMAIISGAVAASNSHH